MWFQRQGPVVDVNYSMTPPKEVTCQAERDRTARDIRILTPPPHPVVIHFQKKEWGHSLRVLLVCTACRPWQLLMRSKAEKSFSA